MKQFFIIMLILCFANISYAEEPKNRAIVGYHIFDANDNCIAYYLFNNERLLFSSEKNSWTTLEYNKVGNIYVYKGRTAIEISKNKISNYTLYTNPPALESYATGTQVLNWYDADGLWVGYFKPIYEKE